jgi:hypothetical protein
MKDKAEEAAQNFQKPQNLRNRLHEAAGKCGGATAVDE